MGMLQIASTGGGSGGARALGKLLEEESRREIAPVLHGSRTPRTPPGRGRNKCVCVCACFLCVHACVCARARVHTRIRAHTLSWGFREVSRARHGHEPSALQVDIREARAHPDHRPHTGRGAGLQRVQYSMKPPVGRHCRRYAILVVVNSY